MSHTYLVDPSNYALLGVLDASYASVTLSRRLWGIDSFQMRVHRRRAYADSIVAGNIVWFPHENDAAYLIESIQGDETGSVQNDWITASGRSLDAFATEERRIIPPVGEAYDRITTEKAETIMKYYVDTHCGPGAEAERQVPGLVIAADAARGLTLSAEYRYHTVTQALKEIGMVGGLGWQSTFNYDKVTPADTEVEFDVIAGTDRSASVFFDFEYQTLEEWHELERILDSKTFAIVAGQGEGEERDIVERWQGVPEPEGFARREAFIDARDVALGNTDLLEQRGDAFLAGAAPERSLEANVHQFGSFKYRTHWDMGDIILVRNRPRGLQYSARIVEVHKTFSERATQVTAVLDRPFPTLKEKLSASSSAGTGSVIVDQPTGGGGGSPNLDGGISNTVFGGTTALDGGVA